MKFAATHDIAAPRATVWEALLSEAVLEECLPGCRELSGTAEEGFEATVVQKIGPVKATFKSHVSLSEMEAPSALTLSGEGKGGAAGFAKGSARVTLEEIAEGTRLAYDVDVEIGGKLAQLGSRMIHGVAHKLSDQFFTRFKEVVEGPEEAEDPAAEESAEAPKGKGWFGRMMTRKAEAE
ncbi:carbon monoxide dehydrogenase subunit G [Rhodovulum sulfidophilum]|nr:carbon monoxide dehydrogenase subunit G [Rhodovulum sulfidophilum]